ncbi:hypothetical protein V8C86DRAFT_2726901 [Haematococcus lacustris]
MAPPPLQQQPQPLQQQQTQPGLPLLLPTSSAPAALSPRLPARPLLPSRPLQLPLSETSSISGLRQSPRSACSPVRPETPRHTLLPLPQPLSTPRLTKASQGPDQDASMQQPGHNQGRQLSSSLTPLDLGGPGLLAGEQLLQADPPCPGAGTLTCLAATSPSPQEGAAPPCSSAALMPSPGQPPTSPAPATLPAATTPARPGLSLPLLPTPAALSPGGPSPSPSPPATPASPPPTTPGSLAASARSLLTSAGPVGPLGPSSLHPPTSPPSPLPRTSPSEPPRAARLSRLSYAANPSPPDVPGGEGKGILHYLHMPRRAASSRFLPASFTHSSTPGPMPNESVLAGSGSSASQGSTHYSPLRKAASTRFLAAAARAGTAAGQAGLLPGSSSMLRGTARFRSIRSSSLVLLDGGGVLASYPAAAAAAAGLGQPGAQQQSGKVRRSRYTSEVWVGVSSGEEEEEGDGEDEWAAGEGLWQPWMYEQPLGQEGRLLEASSLCAIRTSTAGQSPVLAPTNSAEGGDEAAPISCAQSGLRAACVGATPVPAPVTTNSFRNAGAASSASCPLHVLLQPECTPADSDSREQCSEWRLSSDSSNDGRNSPGSASGLRAWDLAMLIDGLRDGPPALSRTSTPNWASSHSTAQDLGDTQLSASQVRPDGAQDQQQVVAAEVLGRQKPHPPRVTFVAAARAAASVSKLWNQFKAVGHEQLAPKGDSAAASTREFGPTTPPPVPNARHGCSSAAGIEAGSAERHASWGLEDAQDASAGAMPMLQGGAMAACGPELSTPAGTATLIRLKLTGSARYVHSVAIHSGQPEQPGQPGARSLTQLVAQPGAAIHDSLSGGVDQGPLPGGGRPAAGSSPPSQPLPRPQPHPPALPKPGKDTAGTASPQPKPRHAPVRGFSRIRLDVGPNQPDLQRSGSVLP